MFDALRSRLAKLETIADRALAPAAIHIQDKLRETVKAGRKRGQKKRKLERALRKLRGDSRKVRMPKGSGVSIDALRSGDTIVVTASKQVQHLSVERSEREAWMQIVGAAVRIAGAP